MLVLRLQFGHLSLPTSLVWSLTVLSLSLTVLSLSLTVLSLNLTVLSISLTTGEIFSRLYLLIQRQGKEAILAFSLD